MPLPRRSETVSGVAPDSTDLQSIALLFGQTVMLAGCLSTNRQLASSTVPRVPITHTGISTDVALYLSSRVSPFVVSHDNVLLALEM